MLRRLSGALLILATIALMSMSLASPVVAQECIEIEGFKWPRSYIGVYIAEGTNDIQRQQAEFAMSVWFSSQNWFIDSYKNQQGAPYLLYLSNQPGQGIITLSFFTGEGVNFGGQTVYSYGGQYPSVQIQINLPPDHAQDPHDLYVEDIILHELGHALGLGHSQNQQDAMYSSVDAVPQSYGLPSTLDLDALYQLSKISDASSLGEALCLSGAVAYGLPPWLQKIQNGFTLQIPLIEIGATYIASFSINPQSVAPGGSAEASIRLMNTGNYPMRVVSATLQPDYGPPLSPKEQFPVAADPGAEVDLTYFIAVPISTSLGQHQVSYQIQTVGLATDGWSSIVQSKSGTVQMTVSQITQNAGYSTTCDAQGNCGIVITAGTQTFNPCQTPFSCPLTQKALSSAPLDWLWWTIIAVILILALMLGITKARRKASR